MPARHDLADDPAVIRLLALTRLGTSVFSRELAALGDAELAEPSRMPLSSRREIVAFVGLQARMLAERVAVVRGHAAEPHDAHEPQEYELDFTASLPAQALRNLYLHSFIHLDVEWRDLPAGRWPLAVDTVELRCRSIWRAAVALDGDTGYADMPEAVLEVLAGGDELELVLPAPAFS